MQVFTPRTRTVHGRPDWLFARAGRTAVPLPADLLGRVPREGGPFLAQAFVADEGDDAVPMDQVVFRAGEGPTLALLPGRYRVVIVSRGGEVARTELRVR
jgi:hypothetical protein